MQKLIKTAHPYLPLVAWAIAIISTVVSLYMSEVLHWPPCVLCWYQRICMYPLAAILAVGVVYKDRMIARYVLPLSLVGLAIALFHSLLQWKILPDSVAPCVSGISCTTLFTNWFGFVTIPFMSLLAFGAISLLMLAYAWGNKNE